MTDTLVIYYSFTGNSKKVANYVKEKCQADSLELEPLVPFSSDYDEVVAECRIMRLSVMSKLRKLIKTYLNIKR